MQGFLRRGGRLRARRRMRHDSAQAIARCDPRPQSHPRGDPRLGLQSGWAQQRPHRTQRAVPGGRHRSGLVGRGSSTERCGLHRSARNRNLAGRPDRGGSTERSLRESVSRGRAATPRLGEDQSRPPGVRGGNRRTHQARALDPAWTDSRKPASGDSQSPHRMGSTPARDSNAACDLGAPGQDANRWRELLWVQRHERPCRGGRVCSQKPACFPSRPALALHAFGKDRDRVEDGCGAAAASSGGRPIACPRRCCAYAQRGARPLRTSCGPGRALALRAGREPEHVRTAEQGFRDSCGTYRRSLSTYRVCLRRAREL